MKTKKTKCICKKKGCCESNPCCCTNQGTTSITYGSVLNDPFLFPESKKIETK